MGNPRFVRAFARYGRLALISRSSTCSSNFVARSNSLCEITLMISSVVSGHGHRGLLATPEAPEEAGCIACDRNEERQGFSPRLPKAAEVLRSARHRAEMNPWTEEESV